jgi:hypothetical protein
VTTSQLKSGWGGKEGTLSERKAIKNPSAERRSEGQEKNGISACKAEATASYAGFSLDLRVADSVFSSTNPGS